jgi:hypothetical protein
VVFVAVAAEDVVQLVAQQPPHVSAHGDPVVELARRPKGAVAAREEQAKVLGVVRVLVGLGEARVGGDGAARFGLGLAAAAFAVVVAQVFAVPNVVLAWGFCGVS